MVDFYSNVYNHVSGSVKRPLASVAFFKERDINKGSLLEQTIDTFVSRNIYETFGISYLEYMRLPSDICRMLTERALKALEEKNKMAEGVNRDLKNFT